MSVLRSVFVVFQFTLPHGERPNPFPLQCSISSFQFTLPHGERLPADREAVPVYQFQFTLPHGERQASMTLEMLRLGSFNSRSRMGSDPPVLHRFHVFASFNSRSRMGSDLCAPLSCQF